MQNFYYMCTFLFGLYYLLRERILIRSKIRGLGSCPGFYMIVDILPTLMDFSFFIKKTALLRALGDPLLQLFLWLCEFAFRCDGHILYAPLTVTYLVKESNAAKHIVKSTWLYSTTFATRIWKNNWNICANTLYVHLLNIKKKLQQRFLFLLPFSSFLTLLVFYAASDSKCQEKFKIIAHLLWLNIRKEKQLPE